MTFNLKIVNNGHMLALILILLTSCGNNPQKTQVTAISQKQMSEYAISISNGIKALTPEEAHKRDTLYRNYTRIKLYKTLFVDKIVDVKYIPVVEGLGYLLAHKVDTLGYEVLVRTKEYTQKLQEKDSLLLYATSIEPLGGYIPEFEDLVTRYIRNFGYLGKKGDSIIIKDSSIELPFSFNLSYAMLLIDPSNKDALDALGESVGRKISFWNDTTDISPILYSYPQFVFRQYYIRHLKTYYPDSKFIPQINEVLPATELADLYDENEVAADRKFKNNRVAVRGKIFSVSKDVLDEPYVLLETGNFLSKVHCGIKESIAISLKKGEIRTFVGKCNGLTLQDIFLEDCEVLE